MLLILTYCLLAFFLTASTWRRGDRWWHTVLAFAFFSMGVVAATIAFFFVSSL